MEDIKTMAKAYTFGTKEEIHKSGLKEIYYITPLMFHGCITSIAGVGLMEKNPIAAAAVFSTLGLDFLVRSYHLLRYGSRLNSDESTPKFIEPPGLIGTIRQYVKAKKEA
ncbi:hypothetical protein ACFL1H_01520 [Nanoarchaeota archaeon]